MSVHRQPVRIRAWMRAITIMETVMAIILLNVIVLAAGTFGYVGHRFLQSSMRKSVVLNEQSYIIEHIHRRVLRAAGDPDNPSLAGGGTIFTVRFNDGTGDPSDSTYAGAGYVAGTYSIQNGTQLWYNDTAGTNIILSVRVVDFDVAISLDENRITIKSLVLRYDPNNPTADVKSNPEAYLSQPVVISSYSQSAAL